MNKLNEKIDNYYKSLNLYVGTLYSKNLFKKILFVLILIPVILGALYIALFGVNLVFWDQWEIVTLIEKLNIGTLTLEDLFTQHNEHRIFFPRIIMLILAEISHYNTFVEMFFSWFLVVVSLFLIFKMYKQDFGDSSSAIMKFIPISWIIFNFRQFENILWGWQIGIYLAVLGFIVSIYMLEKSDNVNYRFFIGIAGAIVSSFSFANGLVVWLAGIIFIILSGKKNKRSLLSIWIFFAILTYISYLYGFQRPTVNPDPLFALKNPWVGIQYLLAAIGSPLAFEKYRAIIAGILLSILIGIAILTIRYNKTLLRNNAKWFALIGFSNFSAIMMMIGRSGFGVEQALSSRYVTFTQFAFIGLYCVLLNLYNNSINTKYREKYFFILVVLISVIISGIFMGYTEGYKIGEESHEKKLGISYFLLGYDFTANDILKQLNPIPDIVKQRGEILKKYNLNVFNDHEYLLYDVKEKVLPEQRFIDGAGIIGDTMKFIIFESPMDNVSSIIEFEKNQIPHNAVLKFDIALDPKSWSPYKGDGVTFKIYIRENETKKQIFSKYLDPKNNRDERKWNYNEADISEYGGKNVTIIFSTLAGPNNDSTWDLAWWGEPRIEVENR